MLSQYKWLAFNFKTLSREIKTANQQIKLELKRKQHSKENYKIKNTHKNINKKNATQKHHNIEANQNE